MSIQFDTVKDQKILTNLDHKGGKRLRGATEDALQIRVSGAVTRGKGGRWEVESLHAARGGGSRAEDAKGDGGEGRECEEAHDDDD
jgi:hypothetical protein